jgi:FkbM family methyltransferase
LSALGTIKRLVNARLAKRGHTVAHESVVPSFDRLVGLLGHARLMPQTVFDIGVAYGTPWLYNAFPTAKFHLIDPTRESLPYMQTWARKLDAEIHNFGLGDQETQLRIAVRPEIGGSSLFDEVGNCEISATYEVPIRRFDRSFGAFARPALCKIDVQGAELMVIEGMGDRIGDFDLLIIETGLIATLQGDLPEFADIVLAMKKRAFALYDIVGITRRPLDRAMAQVDAVFVPEMSSLRSDRRWSN